MKKYARAFAIAVAGLLAALPRPAVAQMVNGQVVKIDEAASKITIKHGPLKSFDMDEGMTMIWRVPDPALLKGLRAGDKIRFEPDRINGQFTATRIEKVK